MLVADLHRLEGRPAEAEAHFREALDIQKSAIREVSIYFATDRKQDAESKSPSFSGERSDTITYGKASVMVAAPRRFGSRAPIDVTPIQRNAAAPAELTTTEVARLTLRRVSIEPKLQEFIADARGRLSAATAYPKQTFIFIHGFNTSFDNALRRTAQLAFDLNFDGAAFLFSWPSRSRLWSYAYDRESATLAVNHFNTFLKAVIAKSGAEKVHLIAHSMGNSLLLDALEKLKLSGGAEAQPAFAEIVLHAPDVDSDRFRQAIKAIDGVGKHVTLYASQSDVALGLSSAVWGLVGRAGAAPSVLEGVETIDVSKAGASLLGLNHDLYATNSTVFSDMRRLLTHSQHPPDARTPLFKPNTTEQGVFWRYQP